MLNKIFNRKYVKTIEMIEAEIETIRGQKRYYENELRLGGRYYDTKRVLEQIDALENEKIALMRTLEIIKTNLH